MAPRTSARRASDAASRAATTVLACPTCRSRLSLSGSSLSCAAGHNFPEIEGYYDLWPAGTPEPSLDFFSGPYGAVYDAGIKARGLATIAARALWGADAAEMYRLMDAGVKCGRGEVVLDVPCGGAPGLRTAAGRMLGTYLGLDASAAMLGRAASIRREEQLDGVILARGDATDLPISDESIDRVLCFNGLHVLHDKDVVLNEFVRVLRPGGEAWGTVVVRQGGLGGRLRPWTSSPFFFFHPADADELSAMARAAGFSEWEQERTGSILIFRGRTAS